MNDFDVAMLKRVACLGISLTTWAIGLCFMTSQDRRRSARGSGAAVLGIVMFAGSLVYLFWPPY